MQINIGRDRTYLRAEASNFVCQHARRRGFDRIVPVVVVVAERVGKV